MWGGAARLKKCRVSFLIGFFSLRYISFVLQVLKRKKNEKITPLSSPFRLKYIIVASFIRYVQAEDKTLPHGWQPEPNGRGTWSILWGCRAPIIICTWSTLHLDVPNYHGALYLFLRRVVWMAVAATAPELVLLLFAENFFKARDELKDL